MPQTPLKWQHNASKQSLEKFKPGHHITGSVSNKQHQSYQKIIGNRTRGNTVCQKVANEKNREVDLQALIKDMATGTTLVVSDGSYINNLGAAACAIEDKTTQGRLVAASLASGQLSNHSTFHSKLAGIYEICLLLRYLGLSLSMLVTGNSGQT